ncbi:protocatechuate 3,4-dioxygenase [Caldimonas thermodepolymerans]|uniref:protocatechuate 3,4-dioxygenase n=1 Tax=Caldimonas thermodepolymerans TaxID=215580 RepID=UPI002235C7C4|nr:protocatechuate 3,4-dioxygenase [Caldimonas thermodepolymerans]UZG43239.1 protocatechuate 3,4-dioxygenase [Caldimonas thermodepolymerans]
MHAPARLRRRLIAGTAAAIALPALVHHARAQPRLRPTPAQTEGPYYPVELPEDTDFDLLVRGTRRYTRGQPAWLDGRVLDTAGRPMRGATVEIWQCDHQGRYHHPGDGGRADPDFQGYGRVTVDAQGRYRFRTIRPVPYTGRTPHIHVKVRLGRRELLTTQVYVEGEPGNARDWLWRHLDEDGRRALTVPFRPGDGALQAHFPIVVEA